MDPVKKTKKIRVRIETPEGKRVETPKQKENTPSKDENRRERVKSLISDVQTKKHMIEDIEEEKKQVVQKMDKLKKEVHQWMRKTNQPGLLWKNRSIHPRSCSKLPRTEASDVLEIVREIYGEQALERVVEELDQIRKKKYDGQYDVRFLEAKEEGKRKKRKASTHHQSDEMKPKKKRSLIL